ncbi:MAG: hypothetical protein ACI95S_001084, partial [Dinoroseobacter sp.]
GRKFMTKTFHFEVLTVFTVQASFMPHASGCVTAASTRPKLAVTI